MKVEVSDIPNANAIRLRNIDPPTYVFDDAN